MPGQKLLDPTICTFMIISRRILLRVRNISDNSCRENKNRYIMFSNFFFLKNHAVYEVMWKEMSYRPQVTIGYNGYMNARQCYIIHTFPVLFAHNNEQMC